MNGTTWVRLAEAFGFAFILTLLLLLVAA